MRTLVDLSGLRGFSVEKLDEITTKIHILENQPQLDDNTFVSINPEFNRREIVVSKVGGLGSNQVEYHVMDKGCAKNIPETVVLGSKIYSEEDVKRLEIDRNAEMLETDSYREA